jgi:sugar transferase (PEP-CTERM/EpsH1 system associated)
LHLLTYLSRRHEVHVASLVDDECDLQHVPQVTGRARGFLYEVIGWKLRKLLAMRGLLQGRSITVTYFYSPRLQRRIDELIDKISFDCYFCFSSPMAEYLFRSRHTDGKIANALRVMDLIDVDSYKWRQYAQRAPFWTAWVYRLEAMHLAAYESHIASTFDRLFLTSEQECRHLPARASRNNPLAVSNGVDLQFFNPRHVPAKHIGGLPLVFTGVMDYWPNIEGISWFVECILPRIQASVPGTQLYVVGSKPTPAVRNLQRSKGVTVTGFVEDIRDYLAAASICVVPLRIARGIQNKVLEAMAMGKPVVTTAQAFEGVQAVPGEDIVVAHGEEDFVQAVINLLRDSGRAERIGARARACAERNYRWDLNLGKLSCVGL